MVNTLFRSSRVAMSESLPGKLIFASEAIQKHLTETNETETNSLMQDGDTYIAHSCPGI
jgi:hypothetical protein